MSSRSVVSDVMRSACILVCCAALGRPVLGAEENSAPTKVYVPYDQLKDVFEKTGQGVFLPYEDFERLWRAAQGRPAGAGEAPFKHLISTARFQGTVAEDLAALEMELTVDILDDGWVDVPVGLGGVAVSKVRYVEPADAKPQPLLRVVDGQYILSTKGTGRYVLGVDFVCPLETKPGLHVLGFKLPSAAITTLELTIPEENMKVDVKPMLAATTTHVEIEGVKSTKLQAFLGSTGEVQLSWKPRMEAAAELEAVVVCEQFQHIDVSEALIADRVSLEYTIHRGGVNAFGIRLPSTFRVTDVRGENISKWDVATGQGGEGQRLNVELFSAAKGTYALMVIMERFLQEAEAELTLEPVATEKVLRTSGLIGITYASRRIVHLEDLKNLARVDTGRLPKELSERPGVTAYRFITSDYGARMAIETARPRITVRQAWQLQVDSDRMDLFGRLGYKVERAGVFQLETDWPEPWTLSQVGPDTLVDDYELKGEGAQRRLRILLKKEQMGAFEITVSGRADRGSAAETVDFALPLADATDVQAYSGGLTLILAEQLRAEVESLGQCQPVSISSSPDSRGMMPTMAFEFKAVDRSKWAGAKFRIEVKPAQVSATVDRLVNIQSGSIEQEAVIQYRIRYAPVDTFYVKMPASLADEGVEITGVNIKEKPRIDALPPEELEQGERIAEDAAREGIVAWAYYKIVLQSKVSGQYVVRVNARRSFGVVTEGQRGEVVVEPILAAGKLSDQNGRIAVAKAATLAIGEPMSEGLIPTDPGSETDLPWEAHRRVATLAFKHGAPMFVLRLPVVVQKEATVFTTIVDGAIIEQVLARDGLCKTHATFLIATSQGDRLSVQLPKGAELTAVLLNGQEAPVEAGVDDERIVRLPPSAGQVARFVLEVAYGLKGVRTAGLAAPTLPESVPTQQTLWRLWLPEDTLVLGHDRVYSKTGPWQLGYILQGIRQAQPVQVDFRLSGQGRPMEFVRPGAGGTLSVYTAQEGVFNVAMWVVILAAGAAMLKLCGFWRVVVMLAAALAAGVIQLWQPLFVEEAIRAGQFALCIVIVLWAAQWVFLKIPRLRERLKRQRAEAAPAQAGAPAAKSEQGPKDKE